MLPQCEPMEQDVAERPKSYYPGRWRSRRKGKNGAASCGRFSGRKHFFTKEMAPFGDRSFSSNAFRSPFIECFQHSFNMNQILA